MYRTDKDGLLPALLRKWFEERVEYRKLSKKFHEEGDKEQSDYFDRRQYLQKIILNSLFGSTFPANERSLSTIGSL